MSELNILQFIKEFFPELYVDVKKYIEQLQQEIGELEKEIGQRTGENESLRKKIAELEKELKYGGADLDLLQYNKQLQQKIAELEKEKQRWKELYNDLHRLHADGKLDKSDELFREIRGLEQEIKRLREENQRLREQYESKKMPKKQSSERNK